MRWLRRGAVSLAVLALLGGAVFLVLDRPRPTGVAGNEADALARRMMGAVRCDAWDDVADIGWTFGGRRGHLWDRDRGFARVTWDDVRVLLDLSTRDGAAYEGDVRLTGAAAARRVEQAWAHWANDSFWLNPVCKAFDAGAERRIVSTGDGGPALLVTYTTGGVTPGDSYLWTFDERGRPLAWRMWVAIVPVGGVRATWDDWIEVQGGAAIATAHRIAGLVTLRLDEVRTTSVPTGPDDPFRELVDPRSAD